MLDSQVKLGTLAGIEVRAHYSSLFVFGAIVAVIAYGYLPAVTPGSSPAQRVAVAIIVGLLLAASIVAHEFGHAVAARRRGRKVPSISLYLFGGAAQIQNENMTPGDEIAIALAGPLASLALAVAFAVAGSAAWHARQQAGILLLDVAIANASLAIFNLLPGFPMDGGRVLRGILWKVSGNVIAATKRAAFAGRMIGYLTVAFGCLLAVRSNVLLGGWAAIMGWFLASLAQSYYRSTVIRVALEGLKARDLCARDLPTLQTSDALAFASGYFGFGAKSRALAVLFGDRPAGVLSDVEAARVPTDEAASRLVGSVMTRVADLPVLDPDDDALALLHFLPFAGASAIMVVADEGATYVGLVRREDIVRYVEMVEDLGNSSAASAKNLRALTARRGKPARQDAASN